MPNELESHALMRLFLQLALVLGIVVLGIVSGGTMVLAQSGRPNAAPPAGTNSSSPTAADSSSAAERQLFDLINLEREKAGVNHLQWDEHLAQAARKHSRLMAEKHDLSHQIPGEKGVPERLAATGSRFIFSAENVAEAQTADEVHMALMASPGHRANILDSRSNAAGVGVVERDGRLFVTEDFARATPIYTEAEFRDAFIAAFNHARTDGGIPAIDTRSSSGLHSIACSTRGDTPIAAAGFEAAEFATFTLSDPEKLPQQLMKYAQNLRLRRMDVGVCFRPDARYGYANFWVVAAFSE